MAGVPKDLWREFYQNCSVALSLKDIIEKTSAYSVVLLLHNKNYCGVLLCTWRQSRNEHIITVKQLT